MFQEKFIIGDKKCSLKKIISELFVYFKKSIH